VMDSGIEIRELKHLLVVAEDKISKLEAEIVELKADDFGIQFSDKSQLDADDEEPNKETY